MAEIRCPNCGKDNPEILDVCQFCLTPLKPESVLRIGEQPTKKNTGELEPILPEWLKDVRQQARDSAEEEAARAAEQPPAPKDEPLDFLAGLASQTGSDEEEAPDWLASLAPPARSTEASSTEEPETNRFAQFDKTRAEPAEEQADQPEFRDKDELSDWFARAAGEPEETVELHHDAAQIDPEWASNFDAPLTSSRETSPSEEEDLSWLRNLEEAAKQTGDLRAPNLQTPDAPSQPSSPQEDLSWLDSLGGVQEPSQSSPRDELGWLDQLGGMPTSQPLEEPEAKPSAQEDLSWLNNLGATPEPVQPFDAAPDRPIPAESFAPGEDLDWLKDLGVSSESTESRDEASAEGPPQPLSSRSGEGAPSAAPFVEADSSEAEQDRKEPEPDWLRSASDAPSMPAPGDISLDWFAQKDESQEQQTPLPTDSSQPAPSTDIFSDSGDESSLSTQELDSLFSAEMPDWLSRPEPAVEEPASTTTVPQPPGGDDSLAPVELPSWVQAMRPMEALIPDAAPGTEDQPEEKEGPLAGLRGVLPGAPMGSSTKPKPISLKLQVSPEQQASAALLEEILGSETSPRSLVDSSFIPAQHVLRWVLTALFLVVLGAVISLRSQSMPVAPGLPAEGRSLASAVLSIPASSKVLVIIDYEPSLAGEMEAIGSPLLNQMVSLGRPNLSFLSTSPNGPALVDRLLAGASITTADGFGYQSGVQYHNLGYLPGGAAGVLGFVDGPAAVVPGVDVGSFSEFAAVVLMTDHAESGRVWVEQLQSRRQLDFALTNQPLVVVASAQAGPLLQPYVSSGQVSGMISGLSDAVRYEASNGRAGAARLYWDAFGIGLIMAVLAIILGSLWSLLTAMRARRPQAEQG